MQDRNGVDIKLGSRAVVTGANDWTSINGKIGTVRAVKLGVSVLRGKPGVRVADGPEGDPEWSAWVKPEDLTVVP